MKQLTIRLTLATLLTTAVFGTAPGRHRLRHPASRPDGCYRGW
jgi:hypothetical protein